MKVLVANDCSLHADNALEEVLQRPWANGTTFHLITVAEPMHVAADSSFGELGTMALQAQIALDNDLQEALKQRANQLSEKFGQANVASTMVQGKPADEIIAKAKDLKANLIVIGSHGHNGFNEGWLGSVAHAVMQKAPCSVEVLRGLAPYAMETKAEKNEPNEESRYLIALKAEDNADIVVDAVLGRPWPAESRFRLVTVVEPTFRDLFADEMKSSQLKEVADKLHQAKKETAEKFIKSCADRLIAKFGKDKVAYHVLEGNTRGMLLQTAIDWPADMVFMGAHLKDKTVLEHFLGSVAQAVVVNAPCSVELVRS